MAEQLATMPLGEFLPVITRTLFPGLLRFRGEPEKLRANALHTLGMLVAVSVPMAAGFCAVSPEVVRVLYGKAWIDAIPLVQILALAAGVESIGGAVANSVVLASGKTTYLFRRGLLLVLIRLPAVILGLWLFGMKGALAGYLLGAVTLSVVNLVTLCELLNAGAKDLIREFWITFVAVALMAGALFAVGREFQPSFDFELNIAALAVKMVVGVAVYTAARFVLWQVSGRPPGIEARGLALAVSARGLILSKTRHTAQSEAGLNRFAASRCASPPFALAAACHDRAHTFRDRALDGPRVWPRSALEAGGRAPPGDAERLSTLVRERLGGAPFHL